MATIGREQLVEILAAVEHDRWAKWQSFVHSLLTEDNRIPTQLIDRWERQIATSYDELSEQEKDSDRAEANRTLDAIEATDEWRVVWLNPEGITS